MYSYYPFANHPWPYSANWYPVPHYFPRARLSYRQYPQVNPSLFMSSAQQMRDLMSDAGILLNKMADSRKFSYDLMSAAQESNQQKVESLVKGTGIQTSPEINYTPDGLKLHFKAATEQVDCCHLTMNIRWM